MSAVLPAWRSHQAAVTWFLGGYPRLVGVLCGLCVTLAAALCLGLMAWQFQLQTLANGHAEAMRSLQRMQADIGGLLDELNQTQQPLCTRDNLDQLRIVLFKYRYARDIGVLGPRRELQCTTSTGILRKPFPPGEGGIDGPMGRSFVMTPLVMAQERVRATVVERGRFNVVLDPNATQEPLLRFTDAVWAGRGSQRALVFQGKRSGWIDPLAPPDPDQPSQGVWAWGDKVYRLTTTLPGSATTLQSVLLPGDLYQNHLPLLAGALVASIVFGFLVADAVSQRCRHFQSMEHRIRFLCTGSNVVCHYQPIIDLATGRAVGCEVLARLRDRRSLVYPDQFIPALLKKNLAWAFDAAVSARALQELGAALLVRGDFKVALNFFPQNLRHAAIAPHLQTCLHATARTDLQIELEVTEYNFAPEIVPELQRLQADGYLVSLDDFGTGFSNLGMVKKVAPDFLKIDRSFVFEMEDASLRSSLIPEIIAIAKAVDSQVIAEGIENAAQARKLQALGVQFGQGYYFAKPMPIAEFVHYLYHHRA